MSFFSSPFFRIIGAMVITRKTAKGSVDIPASKSQTIRALLIALMAEGKSIIRHPLYSSDTLSCMNALTSLGASVETDEDGTIRVDSSNPGKKKEETIIDCGNSGTTAALILPILALGETTFILTGDDQLKKRPFLPLVKALEDLGAETESEGGHPPIRVKGPVRGGRSRIECRSSQYLSGLLLALPLAEGDSKITCSLLYEKPYVRMTQRWLEDEGIDFTLSDDLMVSEIRGGQKYAPVDAFIEGDYSSATFFFVLAALHGTAVTVSGLERDSTQGDRRVLEVLEEMGCSVSWKGKSVTVTGPEEIKGGVYDINDIPDALPALAALACYSKETTEFVNVAQARIKETDRIKVMSDELKRMGADIEERPDGLVIHGKGSLRGGEVSGHRDHRVIMALSVAGTKSDEDTIIDDTESVSVTFPTFYTLLGELQK